MNYPVIKGASYVLAHTPDFIPFGSNQVFARKANDHEYLAELKKHQRTFEEVVAYPANQCFIGNITPEQLEATPAPWYHNQIEAAEREGRFGEVMPQIEFYAMLKQSDVFDLVKMTPEFYRSG